MIFGSVDIPLIEIVFILVIISFIILIETVVVVLLMMQNLKKSKEINNLLNRLAQILLTVKREEVKGIERLRK